MLAKLYVPIREDSPIASLEATKWVAEELTDAFGGCTTYSALGSFIEDGRITLENVYVVECFIQDDHPESVNILQRIAEEVKTRLQQREVAYGVSPGALHLV